MRVFFIVVFTIVLLPGTIFALHGNESIQINLLLESIDTEYGIVKAVVEVKIDDGWHIYYKDPGDFGLPTQFTCKGYSSELRVRWPKPLTISEEIGGKIFTSNIYEGYILFPLEFHLSEKNRMINIELNIEYALCKTNCTPQSRKIILNTTLHDFVDQEVVNLRKNFVEDLSSDM